MRRIGLASSAILGVLLAAAPVQAQQEAAGSGVGPGSTPPVLRYPPSSVRVGLIGGGLALTAAAWGGAYLCAANWPEVPGSTALKVPVVGPWVALAQNDCAADDPDCGFTLYLRGFLTLLDGLIQAGGIGIAGEGVFMTTESNAPAKKKAARLPFEVRPLPVITADATGVGFVGTF